jgi:hypothetical protein
MTGELQFDEAAHRYTVDGKIIPSVTQIISAVGLYEFDYVSADTLAVAAERGRIVHTYIEWYEHGELDETSIDPELQGYFNAYLSMKAAGKIPAKAELIEHRAYSAKYGYAGTLDMLFNGNWIHDHKTGVKSPVHGLQLSGYWLELHPNMAEKPERLTCGYYSADGSWELVEYPYEPFAWLAVVADYKWRVKHNLIRPRWAA